MKKVLLTLTCLFLFSCGGKPEFPFKLVSQRKDTKHSAEAYISIGEFSQNGLKELCEYKKNHPERGEGFNYLYIFDNESNVLLDTGYPISASFMDELPMKNIKACYTYNGLNKYSKLQIYDKNMWESKPIEIDI